MVLTSYANRRYDPIASITFPRMEEWAKRQGIAAQLFREEPQGCPFWHRFEIIRRAGAAEDVLWMDADCWIEDLEFPPSRIATVRAKVIYGADAWGLCDCLTFVRNDPWSRDYLTGLVAVGEPQPGGKQAQSAEKVLRERFPLVERNTAILTGLITDPVTPHLPNAFVYHAWGTALNQPDPDDSLRQACDRLSRRIASNT